MKRLEVGKSTDHGAILIKINVIGAYLPDPFFDDYKEEELTAYDILNVAGLTSENGCVTMTFDRKFLKRLAHSHLLYIRAMREL